MLTKPEQFQKGNRGIVPGWDSLLSDGPALYCFKVYTTLSHSLRCFMVHHIYLLFSLFQGPPPLATHLIISRPTTPSHSFHSFKVYHPYITWPARQCFVWNYECAQSDESLISNNPAIKIQINTVAWSFLRATVDSALLFLKHLFHSYVFICKLSKLQATTHLNTCIITVLLDQASECALYPRRESTSSWSCIVHAGSTSSLLKYINA